jgi:hypothetical protein
MHARAAFAPLVLVLAAFAAACAAPGAPLPPATTEAEASDAFQRLRSLEGRWTGTFRMGDSVGPTEVRYRLTGAGSTLEEILFAGTPHEMVTMYHRDGTRVMLTHYCAAGNQPTMVLLPGGEPGVLRFALLRITNLSDPRAPHMHDALIDVSMPGRLRTSWSHWVDGAHSGDATLDLQRAP